jgi:hypothetical protein
MTELIDNVFMARGTKATPRKGTTKPHRTNHHCPPNEDSYNDEAEVIISGGPDYSPEVMAAIISLEPLTEPELTQ